MLKHLLALACATLAVAVAPPPAVAQSGQNATNVSDSNGASTIPGAAVDASGRVHLAWADNPGGADPLQSFIYYARSTDGGVTFEAPRRLPTEADMGTDPREIRVVVAGQSTVAISWWDPVVGSDGHVSVTAFFVKSTDGGASFSPAIATPVKYRDDGAAKEGFHNSTSLTLAAGPDGEFGLLATIPDVFRGGNVYFSRSADGTAFAEPIKVSKYDLAIPRAAANGLVFLANGDVYATWSESFGDFVNEIRDVLYVTSSDGGRTFSAPTKVAHVKGVVGAALLVGGAVGLATQSQKGDHTPAHNKFFRSTNGGRDYGPRVRVARPRNYTRLNENSVAANASGVVAIAWAENSSFLPGQYGIYVAVSRDGGKHFEPPALVMEGLFLDPPAVTVGPGGEIGVAFSSGDATLADREVLFLRTSL